MTKVYVVTGSCGDYSERQDWSVCAFTTDKRAEEFAVKLKELQEFNAAFRIRMQTEFEQPHAAAFDWWKLPTKPKASLMLHTAQKVCAENNNAANKKLFRQLQQEHLERIQKWEVKYEAARKARAEQLEEFEFARAAWIKENYNPPVELNETMPYNRDLEKSFSYRDYTEYSSYELDLLD
jgi:outer membrane biogenesis lipoprotein LolB